VFVVLSSIHLVVDQQRQYKLVERREVKFPLQM